MSKTKEFAVVTSLIAGLTLTACATRPDQTWCDQLRSLPEQIYTDKNGVEIAVPEGADIYEGLTWPTPPTSAKALESECKSLVKEYEKHD